MNGDRGDKTNLSFNAKGATGSLRTRWPDLKFLRAAGAQQILCARRVYFAAFALQRSYFLISPIPIHPPDPRFRFFCSAVLLRLAPPLPRAGERDDDAVQRPQLLLGAVRPLEQGADVAHGGRALLDVAEE